MITQPTQEQIRKRADEISKRSTEICEDIARLELMLESLQQNQPQGESGEDAFKEWLKATHPELYYTEENTQRGVDMREAWAAWQACEANKNK